MKKSPLYIIVLFMLLLSCELEQPVVPVKENFTTHSNFNVKNGRLVFNNFNDLTVLLNEIVVLSDTDLDAWTKSARGFRSWRLSNGDGELPRDYASIINQDGVYQVGKDIIVHH